MSSKFRVDNWWVLVYTGGIKGDEIMKKLLIGILMGLLSLSVVGSDLTLFAQPDDRVPYFGVRGTHEFASTDIKLSIEWEVGSFVFIEPRPNRDLTFYIFQVSPQIQFNTIRNWKIGTSLFMQYRTNHLGHYVLQPEFFIKHEW